MPKVQTTTFSPRPMDQPIQSPAHSPRRKTRIPVLRNRKLCRQVQKRRLRGRQSRKIDNHSPVGQDCELHQGNTDTRKSFEPSYNPFSVLNNDVSTTTSSSSFQEPFAFPFLPQSAIQISATKEPNDKNKGNHTGAVPPYESAKSESHSCPEFQTPPPLTKPTIKPKMATREGNERLTLDDYQIPSPLLYHKRSREILTGSSSEVIDSCALIGLPAIDYTSTWLASQGATASGGEPGSRSPDSRKTQHEPERILAALPIFEATCKEGGHVVSQPVTGVCPRSPTRLEESPVYAKFLETARLGEGTCIDINADKITTVSSQCSSKQLGPISANNDEAPPPEINLAICPTPGCLAAVPAAIYEIDYGRYSSLMTQSRHSEKSLGTTDFRDAAMIVDLHLWADDLGFSMDHVTYCIFAHGKGQVRHQASPATCDVQDCASTTSMAMGTPSVTKDEIRPGTETALYNQVAEFEDEGYLTAQESSSGLVCSELDPSENDWENLDWDEALMFGSDEAEEL